ncbi:MAG: transposase family protein [Bacillus sp. (in: firmicutes)]
MINDHIGMGPGAENRNSKRKIPQQSLQIMEAVMNGSCNNGKTIKTLYMEYKILCLDNMVTPTSFQTFYKEMRVKGIQKVQKYRGVNKHEEYYWTLEPTNQNYGGRAFEIAHIYHIQLDTLLDIGNGKLQRPWCTFLIDVFSKRILSFYLAFDSPSSVSNVEVIRECVRNHNSLPQTLVVDGGKEFQSENFDSLLEMYAVSKKVRPYAKAKNFNVVERLFGYGNESFIQMLLEITQIMMDKRQELGQLHLKNRSVWNLDSLRETLTKWIDEVYDVRVHPAYLNSPKELFNNSIETTGK